MVAYNKIALWIETIKQKRRKKNSNQMKHVAYKVRVGIQWQLTVTQTVLLNSCGRYIYILQARPAYKQTLLMDRSNIRGKTTKLN